MINKNLIASVEQIESQIFLVRGQRIMLDEGLAAFSENRSGAYFRLM